MRSFMSTFLSGRKFGPRANSKLKRQEVFKAGMAEWNVLRAAGGAEVQKHVSAGAAGTASFQATGMAFGKKRRYEFAKQHPSSLKKRQELPFQRRDATSDGDQLLLDVVALGQTARSSLRDYMSQASVNERLMQRDKECKLLVDKSIDLSQRAPPGLGQDIFSGLSLRHGLTHLKYAPGHIDFDLQHVVPPAADIASRVLKALSRDNVWNDCDPPAGSPQADLLKAWSEMHVVKRHKDAGNLPPLSSDKGSLFFESECRRVGSCMCSVGMVKRKQFRTVLKAQLGKWSVKGSPGRQLYDKGLVVIRFFSDASVLKDWFYYVGYGNLNEYNFTCKALVPFDVSPVPLPAGMRVFAADGPAKDIEMVGANLALEQQWSIEMWALDIE